MFISIIDILLRGFAVGLAASITVGPVAVLCIQRTLSKTTRAGIMSGLGVACADTLMAVIAYFFFAIMQAQIEKYTHVLSIVGGIFVVIVGIYIFFQNPIPQIRRNRAGNTTLWKDFASMFGFTIANFVVVVPYILAFFALFGVGTATESRDVASMFRSVLIILGFFGGATTWWVALTSVISLFRRRFRPRHMLTINHVAGIVVGLLGIYTILSTVISISNGAQ